MEYFSVLVNCDVKNTACQVLRFDELNKCGISLSYTLFYIKRNMIGLNIMFTVMSILVLHFLISLPLKCVVTHTVV